MFPATPSVLALVLLHAPAEAPPPAANCEEVQRIELSLMSTATFEVCVSPGLLTGFRFDAPVTMDLQDDVRFEDVMRSRSGVGLVPPKDLAPGERLRFTAHLGGGESPQTITFTLVVHRGRATHQVEVYHDQRTRESYQQQMEQEHAENQHLRQENQRLQAQLVLMGGLRSLFLAGELGDTGVLAQQLRNLPAVQPSDDALYYSRVVTYHSKNSVAVEVELLNSGSTPWSVAGASLVSPTGERLAGVRIGQVGPIPPGGTQRVFIEADAADGIPLGEVTLRLWGEDGRAITIPKVTFP
ncbi:MAG TPA: DUF2381 family protein [Archangium sp.]|nr:DUF2381 family protein [Archangium sp.]